MHELPGPEMSFLTLIKVKITEQWMFDDNLYKNAQGFCFLTCSVYQYGPSVNRNMSFHYLMFKQLQ